MKMEQPQNNNNPPDEKNGISKRSFIKGGAAFLGLAAVGAVGRHVEQSLVDEKMLHEEGVVTKVKFLPRRLGLLPGARVSSTVELPERYDIYVKTSKGVIKMSVSEKESSTYCEGDKVDVTFKRHPLPGFEHIHKVGFGIESIKKVN